MNKNGWTGGQYSLFRAVFGAYLLVHFCRLLSFDLTAPGAIPTGVAVACSFLFLVGLADRLAALAIAVAGILLHGVWVPAIPLLLHCVLPGRPYGSWGARGRADPAGGWYMPQGLWRFSWVALAVAYVYVLIALLVKLPISGLVPGLLALHVFAYDPAWIHPLETSGQERIFYDGHCGLCHRAVRFVLAEDPSGRAFRFAPIQSEAFLSAMSEEERARLPDSLIVVTDNKTILARSAGALHVGRRLGGFWRGLADAADNIPARTRDAVYDTVARMRHRLFRKPEEVCPTIPEGVLARFDP